MKKNNKVYPSEIKNGLIYETINDLKLKVHFVVTVWWKGDEIKKERSYFYD